MAAAATQAEDWCISWCEMTVNLMDDIALEMMIDMIKALTEIEFIQSVVLVVIGITLLD